VLYQPIASAEKSIALLDEEKERFPVLADTLRYNASGAKRDGILRLPARALHIELPRSARTDWRALYTAIVAELVAEAAKLPGLR